MDHSSVGERLSEGPAPEIVEYLFAPRMKNDLDKNFFNMGEINMAHVVMLKRQGVIEHEIATQILGAIREIEAQGPTGLELDEAREDLYFNYEHAVASRTSPGVGGQMHTARSRNDLGATMTRMQTRGVLASILEELARVRDALISQAQSHIDTVMPGYTHLQPAQPITLGHYFTAIEQALSRDFERVLAALEKTNHSPLGAAALAGSGYSINRDIPAELLGFDGLIVNTLDSVASRDYLLEALAAASILGVTLSRLAQDLFVWYSWEFRMIDFRDRVASTSSIMPQKKNPVILETIKGRSSHALGALTSAVAGVRSTNYTNLVDGNRDAFTAAWQGLESLRVCLVLSRLALENLVVNKELMYQRCAENFSTVTELADTMVAEWKISFREAHEIVGYLVRTALDQGLSASSITSEMVEEAGRHVLEREVSMSQTLVSDSLSPRRNIEVRSNVGGPAPEQVQEMIKAARKSCSEHRSEISRFRERWSWSREKLDQAVDEILQGQPA
jgi:argininosuccinate lyase